MRSPQDLVQMIIGDYLQPGDLAIDASVKAGDITRFLAARVGDEGHVIGFSAEKDEIDSAATSLFLSGLNARVEFIHRDFSAIPMYLNPTEPVGIIMAQTDADTDFEALTNTMRTALLALKKNGLLVVISYQPAALIELKDLASQLPSDSYDAQIYQSLQSQETTLIMQRL